MATNQIRQYSREKTTEWLVPAGTLAGAPVVDINNVPGVALTDRAGQFKSFTLADGSTVTRPTTAVGQAAGSSTVAIDGTWRLAVTGVSAATPKNTLVYAVVAAGAVTSLTLTASGNSLFGKVDNPLGQATAARTAVKIGA